VAFRHIPPHLASLQRRVKPSERSSFRVNTPTPQSQPRPHLISRPSLPQSNERGSFRPVVPQFETEPSPPSRLFKSKFKERGSLCSGRAFVTGANRGSTTEIGRWHGKKRERESGRKFQTKKVQVDLYIPSTVSVGQLAKLLNVRLRMVKIFPRTQSTDSVLFKGTLQRKMDQAGMYEESSYDYGRQSSFSSSEKLNRPHSFDL
jgi:hypothetical protein